MPLSLPLLALECSTLVDPFRPHRGSSGSSGSQQDAGSIQMEETQGLNKGIHQGGGPQGPQQQGLGPPQTAAKTGAALTSDF